MSGVFVVGGMSEMNNSGNQKQVLPAETGGHQQGAEGYAAGFDVVQQRRKEKDVHPPGGAEVRRNPNR